MIALIFEMPHAENTKAIMKTKRLFEEVRSMDEMKIVTKFTRTVISKLVRITLRKRLGYDIDILLNEMNVTIIDGQAQVHLNVDAAMSKDELGKMLKTMGLD